MSNSKKKSYYKHLDKNRAKRRDWNACNKEQKAIYQRQYLSKRYKEDVQFRLRKNIRSRTKQLVSSYFSTSKYLGCSTEEFKQYLESKFQPGMTWDNYGCGRYKWNIDHIIPLSSFNLTVESERYIACNFLNMRPLWHIDNVLKSNKKEVKSEYL